MSAKTHSFKLVGLIKDPIFHWGRTMLEEVKQKYASSLDISLETVGLLEIDWRSFLQGVVLQEKGDMWMFDEQSIFFHNGKLVGGIKSFETLLMDEFHYQNCRPLELYEAMAEEAYRLKFARSSNDVVYLDISIDNGPSRRLLIELFSEVCPRTCYNFKCLCTGEKGRSEENGLKLHYQGSILHRVVKNGWVQGGDIDVGKGNGGYSVYGATFEDESFAVPFDRRGVLAMANHGRHTNRSQFFITFQACPWMNKKYVAFGRVIEGFDLLSDIEALETFNERPKKDCIVQSCGVFFDAEEAAKLQAAKEEERKKLAMELKAARAVKVEKEKEVEEIKVEQNGEVGVDETDENKRLDDTLDNVADNTANFIV